MKGRLIWIAFLIFFGVALMVIGMMSGEGALQKRLTLSGIYAVEIEGHHVVCFVNKDGGSMHCIPKSQIK